jgi:radical SAM superfamily enzyme YgiQ (UPF0313 family)
VPLAAAYLKLFARSRGLEDRFDIEILPAVDASSLGDQALLDEIVARRPSLLGFTCYLWNVDRTLWLAARAKQLLPETRIILGGPEVTPGNAWVLDDTAIDFAAVGEGEQTFAEFLEGLGGSGHSCIAGLGRREGGRMRFGARRLPMPELDAISSPYLAGILNAGDQEQLLLETIRGCIFKCKFCYYPKAYDGLYYVSRDKVLANLAHARENGAREVYLLDPTLNQRRDFLDFLDVLKAGNPDGSLEYHAELRAEGITPAQAERMREANFREVEIGLQSIDPAAQELMERTNSLKAFEKGIRALQAEGIKTRVDLIVGLPGDTVDSVRRGMHYLAERKLYDEIQVFQLSILPGTAFREEAVALGLEHQARPPYYVLRTPTLSLDQMLELLGEAEDVFETEFDALPPPALEARGGGPPRVLKACLDGGPLPPLPLRTAQAFTLWLSTSDPYRSLPRAEAMVREVLSSNPFTTIQIVLETREEFPFDVFRGLEAATKRDVNVYLDRFHEFTPGRKAGAQRIVTVFPAASRGRMDPEWIADALERTDVVWASEDGDRRLVELERRGEWAWEDTRCATPPGSCA